VPGHDIGRTAASCLPGGVDRGSGGQHDRLRIRRQVQRVRRTVGDQASDILVERSAGARETPIGHLPQSLETRGLALPGGALDELLQVDVGGWLREVEQNEAFLAQFGRRLPAGVRREHEALLLRLTAANN